MKEKELEIEENEIDVEENEIEVVEKEEEIQEEQGFELKFRDEEEFDAMFEQLETIYESEHRIDETLYLALIQERKEVMDNERYLKLMYYSALRFKEEENQRAMHYCALRMQDILNCMNGTQAKPAMMSFHEYTPSEEMLSFVEEYCAFLVDAEKYVKNRMLSINTLSMLIVFILFYFIFKYVIWISVAFALGLGALNYFVSLRKLSKTLAEKQKDALSNSIGEDLKEFDRLIRYL